MTSRRTLVALAILTWGCGHADDATLRAHFPRNKAALSRIVQMATEDSHLFRVAKDFIGPTRGNTSQRGEPQLASGRWDAYRKLFDEAEVPQGFMRVSEAPDRLLFIVTTVPGGAKGYAYCPTRPAEVVASLDSLPNGKRHWQGFAWIEGPWYLFREIDIQ